MSDKLVKLQKIFLTIFTSFLFFLSSISLAQKVVPIKWEAFKNGNPKDRLSLIERDILLNTNKFALTTWYNDIKKFNEQTDKYLDLGGIEEGDVRAVASEAFAIAVSCVTGIYNSEHTGVSKETAERIVLQLTPSVAYWHKANNDNGWGDQWQSALWAAYCGTAGWLMWDRLSPEDQQYVKKMVEYEANRMNNYIVPYMRGKNESEFNSEGDSKSEENSWNAMILHVAMAMMPDHPNWKTWMKKNIELLLSANARPQDVTSSRKFHGRRLNEILQGSNYNSDGTVTNHNRIHPDYMSCTAHSFFNALMFMLANKRTPKAAMFNIDNIYKTMVEFKFSSPPYLAPGGTVYVIDSGKIYYPEENDWGRERKMHFALMDCQVDAFKADKLVKKKGRYWEAYHSNSVLNMQKRNTDGRTYQAKTEDTFKGREEWVAAHAAQAYLTKWLSHQKKFKTTNKAYSGK